MLRIILLGAPGVGKGTHAVELSKEFGLVHVSSGDIFRDAIKSGRSIGETLKGYMDKGELVPDRIVNEIIIDRLNRSDCEKGFILDGYPRTINQAKIFDNALQEMEQKIDMVLNLVADEKVIKFRLTGRRICRNCGGNFHIVNIPPKNDGICDYCSGELYQREDDKGGTISNRLTVYKEQTAELISYYREKGILKTINAEVDRLETYRDIVRLLRK
ncbi:adenylate kinase [Chlamydiota bacterium]